jgi:XTP/dITP diphosphohydrolase
MHADRAVKTPLLSIVVASNNSGKVRELNLLLSDLPIEWLRVSDVLGRSWSVEETGATFEENAVIKAGAASQATGFIALADDSGLEVDVLGGSPGVRSARYAHEHATDEENNAALLDALNRAGGGRWSARFRCVLAVVVPGMQEPLLARGVCEGFIGQEPIGENGFGYDPLFRVDALAGRSMAALTDQEKGQVSHRGEAVRQLRPVLTRLLETLGRQVNDGAF